MDSFTDDIKQSNLLTTNTLDLTSLTEQYENTLKETLEIHAPLRRRVITVRPSAPWYHEDIGDNQEKASQAGAPLKSVKTVCQQTGVC